MESVTESQFATATIRILPSKEAEPARLQFVLEIQPDHPHYSDFSRLSFETLNLASTLLALVRVAGPGPFLLLPASDPPQMFRLPSGDERARRLAEAFEGLFRYGNPSENVVKIVEHLVDVVDNQAHGRSDAEFCTQIQWLVSNI